MIFRKVIGWLPHIFLRSPFLDVSPSLVFFCEFYKNFQNSYSREQLCMVATENVNTPPPDHDTSCKIEVKSRQTNKFRNIHPNKVKSKQTNKFCNIHANKVKSKQTNKFCNIHANKVKSKETHSVTFKQTNACSELTIKVWNIPKVNSEDTRFTSVISFWYLDC